MISAESIPNYSVTDEYSIKTTVKAILMFVKNINLIRLRPVM